MFERLLGVVCQFDDFCQAFGPHGEARLLSQEAQPAKKRGPQAGLADSEIMTILVLYHSWHFRHFKAFYEGVVLNSAALRLSQSPLLWALHYVDPPRVGALDGLSAHADGAKDGPLLYRRTPLPVCHPRRINRHKVFAGLAKRGKTSVGWFFGFKLHLVFNHERQIVALTLTPGNVHDTTPVSQLTQRLIGKLFGDKGYVGKDLAHRLLRRGLVLMTRVRRNMKRLPVSFLDKVLLNGRNIVETIIGHSKEFSSLRLPKHRSVFNAFTHLTAALVAYQINPLPPKPIGASIP